MLSDEDSKLLRQWLVERLKNISHADSEILAEYVVVLFKNDDRPELARDSAIKELRDFLQDETERLVDEVIHAIRRRSFVPSYNPTVSSDSLHGYATTSQGNSSVGPARKRSFGDHSGGDSAVQQSSHYGQHFNTERPSKQPRRGRGGFTRGVYNGRGGGTPGHIPQYPPDPPLMTTQMPPPRMAPFPQPAQPSFSSLEPSDPTSAMMALHAMGFPPSMPGFPPAGAAPPQSYQQFSQNFSYQGHGPANTSPGHRRPRCAKWDTERFCPAGNTCQFEHNEVPMPSSDTNSNEYDPSNALIPSTYPSPSPSRTSFPHSYPQSNGSQRGARTSSGPLRTGFARASFSSTAPSNDNRMMAIVVEQIPDSHLDIPQIRSFFAQFGQIDDVKLQPEKRLAILHFGDRESAQRAYSSPKAIFDNRFVKVYWYRPSQHTDRTNTNELSDKAELKTNQCPTPDYEQMKKRQVEAQLAYEEKNKKIAKAASEREDLDRRIKAQAEERRLLMEKLEAKTSSSAAAKGSKTESGPPVNGIGEKRDATVQVTPDLKAKYAELLAEAERLGVPANASSTGPPDPPAHASAPAWRGSSTSRGPYRGRAPSYAGVRGRGGGGRWGSASFQSRSVATLDNRPKSVVVTVSEDENALKDVEASGEKWFELLKGFVQNFGEYTSIQPSNAASDAAVDKKRIKATVVSFPQRYLAESFIDHVLKQHLGMIPGLGKVELNWISHSSSTVGVGPNEKAGEDGEDGVGGVLSAPSGPNVPTETAGGAEGMSLELDYDVAEDDDARWR